MLFLESLPPPPPPPHTHTHTPHPVTWNQRMSYYHQKLPFLRYVVPRVISPPPPPTHTPPLWLETRECFTIIRNCLSSGMLFLESLVPPPPTHTHTPPLWLETRECLTIIRNCLSSGILFLESLVPPPPPPPHTHTPHPVTWNQRMSYYHQKLPFLRYIVPRVISTPPPPPTHTPHPCDLKPENVLLSSETAFPQVCCS